MAAQKEEEDRKANQAGLIAAKEEEIATLTAAIETKLTQQGNLAAEVESLKNDVADTQRSLAAVIGVGGAPGEQGLEKARLVNLAHLARQSRATSLCVFQRNTRPSFWITHWYRGISGTSGSKENSHESA